MPRLHPDLWLHRVTRLTPGQLQSWGTKVLILDVDNTLTTHNNPVPDGDVLEWLERMKELGLRLVILSNNNARRVGPFAEALGLEYTADAWKPLKKGFREITRMTGVAPEEMAMVGDQIFTDVWGGNRFGARTVLVEAMEPESHWGFRLKRVLEQAVLRNYKGERGSGA